MGAISDAPVLAADPSEPAGTAVGRIVRYRREE